VNEVDQDDADQYEPQVREIVERVDEEGTGIESREGGDRVHEGIRAGPEFRETIDEAADESRPLEQEAGEQCPADHAPGVRTGATDYQCDENVERLLGEEVLRAGEPLAALPEDSTEPHQRAAKHERLDFEAVRVLSERFRHEFVLADRLEYPAVRRVADPGQQQVVEADERDENGDVRNVDDDSRVDVDGLEDPEDGVADGGRPGGG